MTDLWQLSAAELAAGYWQGSWTPAEALDAILRRLDAVNPKLNAVIAVDDTARQAAQDSTARFAAGAPLGPLDGIPVSIKDNLLMAGLPATWGCAALADFRPEHDELPVAALRRQGAVLFGKTNVPEFTLEGYTDNTVHGVTGNPWSLDLTPGGSSGGAAAALAAGIGPLALGTDGGGSIRRPSAHTCLVGLKPSIGAIARAGGFPSLLLDFEVVGPIGRTVADVAMMFEALAGPNVADRRSLALPRSGRLVRRVLHVPSFAQTPVDPQIRSSASRAAQALSELGYDVSSGELPVDLGALNDAWSQVGQIGLARLFAVNPAWRDRAAQKYQAMADAGAALSAERLWHLLEVIDGLRSSVDAMFSEWDVILTPATAAQPWAADQPYPQVIDGKEVGPRGHAVFTGWVNAAGNPAISLPADAAPDGLPIGVQMVGPWGEDRMLLDMAARYEGAGHGVPVMQACGSSLAEADRRRASATLFQVSPSNSMTWTASPAVTLPRSCSSTTSALASLMLRRMPDPWVPVSRTCRVPSVAADTMPRWYSVRPGFLRIGYEDTACSMGSGEGWAPLMASRASRTSA
jgi:aspartyl-tRNA(Asn)/glutamyl-tRNA(Gln) amidotransferase subunit A